MPQIQGQLDRTQGLVSPIITMNPKNEVIKRAPTIYDHAEPLTLWLNPLTNLLYYNGTPSAGNSNWFQVATSGGAGAFTTLTSSGNTSLATGAGASFSVGSASGANTISIGTGTGDQTIAIGSANNSLSGVSLNAGSAGSISLNASGNVLIAAAKPGNVASPTATVTSNFNVLRAIFTGFTTASAGTQAFTVVSGDILATSGIFVSVANLNASTNGAEMGIQGITQSVGQIIVHTVNNGAGALGSGDNVIITVMILI
jgi:hypothetical protein